MIIKILPIILFNVQIINIINKVILNDLVFSSFFHL